LSKGQYGRVKPLITNLYKETFSIKAEVLPSTDNLDDLLKEAPESGNLVGISVKKVKQLLDMQRRGDIILLLRYSVITLHPGKVQVALTFEKGSGNQQENRFINKTFRNF